MKGIREAVGVWRGVSGVRKERRMREAVRLGRVIGGTREWIDDRILVNDAASAVAEMTRRVAEGGDGVAVGRRVRGVVVDGDVINGGGGEELGNGGRRTLRRSDVGGGGGGGGGSQLDFVVALNFTQKVAKNLRLVRFCERVF